MFYIVFEFKELFISLQLDVWLTWGLDQNVAFLNGQVIYIEKSILNIVDMWLIPLDRVTYNILSTSHTAILQ